MAVAASRQMALGRRAVLAFGAAAVGLVCVTRAQAGVTPVRLAVVDRETGQALKVWRSRGRMFVAGAPGHRYGLRVHNLTDRRVEAVMSVDGVNILSGETAGYDQRGYIFDAYEQYELDGWRKSLSEVADFTFTRQSKSYAALTGRPANVGVIGIAVFDERAQPVVAERAAPPLPLREPPLPPPPSYVAPAATSPPTGGAGNATAGNVTELTVKAQKREQSLQSVPVAVTAFTSAQRDVVSPEATDRGRTEGMVTAERTEEKLGTGHGPREQQVMNLVSFERASRYPRFTQEIEYDSFNNLVAAGVIPRPDDAPRPRPFPSSPEGQGFVPDPPPDPAGDP